MSTALHCLRVINVREMLRLSRLPARQKPILANAVSAFNIAVQTGELDQENLGAIVEGIKSESNPVWEYVTPMFIVLTKHLSAAREALPALIHANETSVRFHVTACLTSDVPREMALEMVKVGIRDKGVRVREKAAEASRRLVLIEMIPDIANQLAVESHAKTRQSMEQELKLLRDGFYEDAPFDTVWVRTQRGVTGVPMKPGARTPKRIREVVNETLKKDAEEEQHWRDVENQVPLRTAREYVDRGKYLALKFGYWEHYPGKEKAVKDFTAAIEIDPEHAEAYFARGDAWSALGEVKKARRDYKRAVSIPPAHCHGFLRRGEFYATPWDFDVRRPDFEKALANFQAASTADPQSAVVQHRLAWACLNLGDPDRAILHANRAIELDATWGDYFNIRGESYLNKGDFVRAFSDFKQGVRLTNTTAFGARTNFAWLMATCPDARIRNGKKAVEWAKSDAAQNGGWRATSTYAAARAEAGDFLGAVHQQNLAIRLAPNWVKELMLARLRVFRMRRPYRETLDLFSLMATLQDLARAERSARSPRGQ